MKEKIIFFQTNKKSQQFLLAFFIFNDLFIILTNLKININNILKNIYEF